jgi:hypothetical protein
VNIGAHLVGGRLDRVVMFCEALRVPDTAEFGAAFEFFPAGAEGGGELVSHRHEPPAEPFSGYVDLCDAGA